MAQHFLNVYVILLGIVLTVLTTNVFADDFVDELVVAVKLNGTLAVTAVPETVVELLAVGRLVVYEEHILLLAGDVGNHTVAPGLLLNVPNDLGVGLLTIELGAGKCPELREVELIALALVEVCRKELALERNGANLGASAADVKYAVFKLLACDLAGEVVGGEPYPRRGKVLTPVLVGVAVAGFGSDNVLLTVPDNLARVCSLHTLCMPEHLEELELAEELAGTIANVKGNFLVDLNIPKHFTVLAHPLGMRLCIINLDMTLYFGLGAEEILCFNRERNIEGYVYFIPTKELVELCGIFTPRTALNHEVRGLNAVLFAFLGLTVNRLVAAFCGIAEEILDEECFFLTGFSVATGKGVPPPVIAAFSLTAK